MVELTPTTALVGHDGWADGRLGSADKSTAELNGFRLIEDFKGLSKAERFAKLGDQTAAKAKSAHYEASQKYQEVIFLTHVPPFKDAYWHQGKISDDDFLPHFASHAIGAALYQIMDTNPDKFLTTLCGHTHSSGEAQIPPPPQFGSKNRQSGIRLATSPRCRRNRGWLSLSGNNWLAGRFAPPTYSTSRLLR